MKPYFRQKDGGWQAIINYKSGGKWKQESRQGFKTKKAAGEWVEKTALSILEDKADNIITSDITIKELCDIFVGFKSSLIRQTTMDSYQVAIKSLSALSSKKVKEVTPYDITSHYLFLRKQTGSSYHAQMRYLRVIFNFAVKDLKILRSNPVNPLKPERKDKRTKYITKDLYEEIKSSCRNETHKLIIDILYYTGMRYSEVIGITMPCVSDNSVVVKHQVIKKTNTLTATLKTKNSEREIPIPDWLVQKIKSLPVVNIDGRIFPNYTTINTKLKPFNVSPHCFRHTYATNLVHQGINLKVASDILGDTFETFCKTYVESSKDLAKEEYKKIISNF